MQLDIAKSPAGSAGPMKAVQNFTRYWLSGRRGLVIGGLAVVIAGLALGWNWLSAIGVAPVILSLAPCAVMCAVGACAMKKGASWSMKE
jgi:hypothetical protein